MGISGRKGFTFTVSALIIALTLISMAFFASEWRRGSEASYNEVLPSASVRLQDRISGDFLTLSGIGAQIGRTGNASAESRVLINLPFEKEGSPLLDIGDYSRSLAYSMRGSGIEATLTSNISGSSAQVVRFPDSGGIAISNEGGNDTFIYTHPSGWSPSSVNLSIFCSKRVVSVSSIAVQGAGSAVSFNITLREAAGTTYNRTATAAASSSSALSVLFDDGSTMHINTSLSASQNLTTIRYTKSPAAYLVLPFDSNSTSIADHSQFQLNFTAGGGNATYSPSWVLECNSGGCHAFDGTNDFISGNLPNLTEGSVIVSEGFENTYDVSG